MTSAAKKRTGGRRKLERYRKTTWTPGDQLPDGVWSVLQAAQFLNRSPDWVYENSIIGKVPSRMDGRNRIYLRADLEAYLLALPKSSEQP